MRFLAFASDYDGTLAHNGKIDRRTLKALHDLKQSGRKLILVTGRELDDLLTIFPQARIFDSIVAENGALLFYPADNGTNTANKPNRKEAGTRNAAQQDQDRFELLTDPPPREFITRLRQCRVSPLSVGHAIVATSLKHKRTVVSTILEMDLDLHVVMNKESVMVLPTGVTKGTGLRVALDELGIAPHNVVAIGDAENDDSLLSMCGFSVAVANAIPSLKRRAHKTTRQEHGAGVVEIIEQIMQSDRK
jgi:HAD superfamily hydrolase (TIGR01484 family)